MLMCAGMPPILYAGDGIITMDADAEITPSAQLTISASFH